MSLQFDDPAILAALEASSPEALDLASFGIVRMARDGGVVAYNRAESALSGFTPANVIGRNFFLDVALCTNNFMVSQKFEDREELDETLDYVFTFRMRPTNVMLRLLKSAASPNQYLLVLRRP